MPAAGGRRSEGECAWAVAVRRGLGRQAKAAAESVSWTASGATVGS